nr:uncharacterized protein LOC105335243 [Crassostrea gigas]
MQETKNRSVVYTRWGKKCPSNAELVLSGFTGGSWYDHRGAAVDLLCLPKDPEWGKYSDGVGGARAFVYGAEFETCNSPGNLHKLADHDVPCDVCLLRNQSVVKMFTARKTVLQRMEVRVSWKLNGGIL